MTTNSNLVFKQPSKIWRHQSFKFNTWDYLSKASSNLVPYGKSSLDLRNSLLAILEASISAISRFCRSTCLVLASSQIRSFSCLYCSLASWKALVISMSCCKVVASLPSDPYGPCLVFIIKSEISNTNVDGIKFYQAPRWAPNVLVG